MHTASINYFSHIFLMPKDLYMTALLKNVMQAGNAACVFVGTPHYAPIQVCGCQPGEKEVSTLIHFFLLFK